MKSPIDGPGTLLISFDCEGKFGIADRITPELAELLSNHSNTAAYSAILRVLESHRMRATFAFVGAFTLHPDELPTWRHLFPEESVDGRPWLSSFFADEQRDEFDGWLNPEPLRLVRMAGMHEIGSHGFSHLPLAEPIASAAVFDREIGAVCALAHSRGEKVHTLVYPGNRLGHVARLPLHGLAGYRDALVSSWRGSTRRAANILREFNFAEPAQPQSLRNQVVAIPAGHILNFQHGPARSLVPRAVTRRRWRDMLERAADLGGVVHLWSHPHNFLVDPGLIDVFAAILSYARQLVAEGRLVNPTLADYCRMVRGSA